MKPVRIIVAGSRDIDNYPLIAATLAQVTRGLDKSMLEIVSGEARGPDRLGARWARQNGVDVTSFPAEWERYGNGAGFIRNEEMAKYATHLLAFWDCKSSGTRDMIQRAHSRGLKVRVVRLPRR